MTLPNARHSGNPETTLGERIRARRPSPIGNNPYTSSYDPGYRLGTSTISGSAAADSALRLAEAKATGEQSGIVSYAEAKQALGWT